ncbi:hypothetical protein DCS_06847 [Drechmeria coniospora]|uniref:Secreted protein n=1 Tax=Drechmeria coniospora TaxID=98403 RepID=A0A151GCR4_DRECN|nr:hypothetical protein DCS_06847 [Drechmeria coniospora]KYK54886.1 hypothetical protein DCS_06847 [Drechmeria coniospora]
MRFYFLLAGTLFGAHAAPSGQGIAVDDTPKIPQADLEKLSIERGLKKNLNCTYSPQYRVSECALMEGENTFDRLGLRVHMFNGNKSGSIETIYGTFGKVFKHKNRDPRIHVLFEAPKPGATVEMEIDVMREFGEAQVPVKRLSEFSIMQRIHDGILSDTRRYQIEALVFEIHHVQSNMTLRNEAEAPCMDGLSWFPPSNVLNRGFKTRRLHTVWKQTWGPSVWTVRERMEEGSVQLSGPCMPKGFNAEDCESDPVYHGYPPVLMDREEPNADNVMNTDKATE